MEHKPNEDIVASKYVRKKSVVIVEDRSGHGIPIGTKVAIVDAVTDSAGDYLGVLYDGKVYYVYFENEIK